MKVRVLLLKTFSVIFFLSSLVFFASTVSYVKKNNNLAFADSVPADNLTAVLPESGMEYFPVSSPTGAVYYGGKMAIIQQDGSLFLYKDGKYHNLKDNLIIKNPHQIKFLSENILLVSDNENLYTLDLNDLSKTAEQFKFDGGERSEPVSGRCFDLNDNYLITISGTSIFTYEIENGGLTSKKLTFQKAKDNTPVCMNNDNEIFYVSTDGKLKKHLISDNDKDDNDVTLINYVTASMVMVADNRYVYYTEGSTVKRVSTDGTVTETLSLDNADTVYDIGRILNPTDICFKGENLLICDSSNDTITEFSIDGEKGRLKYSGFAVAKDKTAYNRAGNSIIKIEKLNGRTAVLDTFKFMIVNDGATKTFNNVLRENLINADDFALGMNDALLYSSTTNEFKLFAFKTFTTSDAAISAETVYDIKFFNGRYYLLIKRGTLTEILSYNPETEAVETILSFNKLVTAPKFTVDQSMNFYVTNVTDGENTLYKFSSANDYVGEKIASLNKQAKAVAVDVAGQIFTLTDDAVIRFTNGSAATVTLRFDGSIKNGAKSFTLSPYDNAVSAVFWGDERLYDLSGLSAVTVKDLTTGEYVITAESTTKDKLKAYTLNEGVISYAVSAKSENGETGFEFNKTVTEKGNVYALICKIQKTLGSGTTKEFLVLAGETDAGGTVTVISDALYANEKTLTLTPTEHDSAYCTTSVGMYYIPIISLNAAYCLSVDGEKVRLTKTEKITVTDTINFLGREYYFAEAKKTINGREVTFTGYVPVSFTTKTLSEDVVGETFTLKTVNKTSAYDENGNILKELEKGETVKVYNVTLGDKTLVSYKEGDAWIKCYVLTADVVTPVNHSIRNAIIIVLVSASVLATSLFLILRKRG